MPIPRLQRNGYLPPGVHRATVEDIERVFAWNPVRKRLVEGLVRALGNLAGAGVRWVWIDGSFVTAAEDPNDVDGCWEPNSWVRRDLLDPIFLDDRPPRDAMRRKYGVDFLIAILGQATSPTIQEFFMADRDGKPKGILLVELERDL